MSLVQRVARKLPEPPPVVELDVADQEQLDSLADRLGEHVDGLDGVVHAIGFAPRVLPRRRVPRRAVGGRVDGAAGVGVLVEVAGHRDAADVRRVRRSAARDDVRRDRRLARLRLDGGREGRPGVHVALPGPRARAARRAREPGVGRAAAHDGREEHPRLREVRGRLDAARAARLGTTPTSSRWRGPPWRSCRTGSPRPPARSCTSTAASTRWVSEHTSAAGTPTRGIREGLFG